MLFSFVEGIFGLLESLCSEDILDDCREDIETQISALMRSLTVARLNSVQATYLRWSAHSFLTKASQSEDWHDGFICLSSE